MLEQEVTERTETSFIAHLTAPPFPLLPPVQLLSAININSVLRKIDKQTIVTKDGQVL